MLDARPAGDTACLGVRYTGIFIRFAKQVLAVNKLQGPSPQVFKGDTQALKLLLLPVGHIPDYVGLRIAAKAAEALADAIPGTRAGHHKIHLTEAGQRTVVDVNGILISQEFTDGGEAQQKLIGRLQ